jgi:hypothetical protein
MGRFPFKKLICLLVGLGVSALAAGSCRSFNEYCTNKMDCLCGNDLDIAECEKEEETTADIAYNHGCKSEYDLAQDCIEQESECDDNGSGCDDNVWTYEDRCEEEVRDYNDCMGD